METDPTQAASSGPGPTLGPYAKAVGWILLRLVLQILAGLVAAVAVIALCSLPVVTSSYGFKMMTAEPFGTDAFPASSAIGYFQLVAECLYLVFVLVEFARALVRMAKLRRP
jgi:hypothetical protein